MNDSCRIALKAVPNARGDALAGWSGGVLRVKVRAPALDGRANEALCAFVAGLLGLPRAAVSLAQGAKSRHKLIEVRGLSGRVARERLGGPPEAPPA